MRLRTCWVERAARMTDATVVAAFEMFCQGTVPWAQHVSECQVADAEHEWTFGDVVEFLVCRRRGWAEPPPGFTERHPRLLAAIRAGVDAGFERLAERTKP